MLIGFCGIRRIPAWISILLPSNKREWLSAGTVSRSLERLRSLDRFSLRSSICWFMFCRSEFIDCKDSSKFGFTLYSLSSEVEEVSMLLEIRFIRFSRFGVNWVNSCEKYLWEFRRFPISMAA